MKPCKSMTISAVSAPALKNIKKNVEAAHTAKLKEEQAAKAKKGKGKGASLKMGTDKVPLKHIKLSNFVSHQINLRGCRICFRAKQKAATMTWTTSCDIAE